MEHIELSDIQGDKSIENQKISLLSSLSLSADALASVINKVIDSDNAKLSLSGGTVAGDLSVSGQVKVGQGISMETGVDGANGQSRFQMTNVGSQVANYDILGGYIEGSCGKYTKAKNKTGYDDITRSGAAVPGLSTKYWFEPQTVGAKVYCILSAWNDPDSMLGRLKLSGDVAAVKEFLADSSISAARWSLILQDGNQPGNFRVTSCWTNADELTAGYVSLNREIRLDKCGIANRTEKDGVVTYTVKSGWDTESKYLDIWNNGLKDEDDNSFYCSTHPGLGNQTSPFFKFAHCEGAANRAIQRFDHVEGRKNIADGRYSHVEGDENISYGWNSHVEGFKNRNYSNSTHIEGTKNVAYCSGAHVEGQENTVGLSTLPCTDGGVCGLHVGGFQNTVVASNAGIVTGSGNWLSGGFTVGMYCGCKLSSTGCERNVATGNSNSLAASNDGVVAGSKNILQNAQRSIVTGNSNKVISEGAAKSYDNIVYGSGETLSGSCKYDLLGGVGNTVVDTDTSIVGGDGIVVLSCNDVMASGRHLDVAGMRHSFVWSGRYADKDDHTKWYGYAADSAGVRKAAFPEGSFCINPAGGANGFYIGNQSLSAIISSAIEAALKAKGL